MSKAIFNEWKTGKKETKPPSGEKCLGNKPAPTILGSFDRRRQGANRNESYHFYLNIDVGRVDHGCQQSILRFPHQVYNFHDKLEWSKLA